MSVNKAILIGRLGKDPELRYMQSGQAIASFSLATSESYKDKSGQKQTKTTWHNIVIWGKLAEVATQYLKKGSQIYLEGKIDNRSYNDRDGNKRYVSEIVIDMKGKMTMLDSMNGKGGYVNKQGEYQEPVDGPPAVPAEFVDDDDLPF